MQILALPFRVGGKQIIFLVDCDTTSPRLRRMAGNIANAEPIRDVYDEYAILGEFTFPSEDSAFMVVDEAGRRSKLTNDVKGLARIYPGMTYEANWRIGSILFQLTASIKQQRYRSALITYGVTMTDVINSHVIYSASVDSDKMQGRAAIPTGNSQIRIGGVSTLRRLTDELGGPVDIDPYHDVQ